MDQGPKTIEALTVPLRAYTATATLVITAALRLWAYKLAALWHGRSPQRARGIMQRWNWFAWKRLQLSVEVQGRPATTPCVYVANHRSYLDIAVLNGALGSAFLSRADVARWPVFGAVAQEVGTVFVDRDALHGRFRAARALMHCVRETSVVVFPEGTTGGAQHPGPFEPGLFRLLGHLPVPVVPVTLRYSDRRAYWVDDLTLWEHLSTRVFRGTPLRCVVHVGESLSPSTDDRALSQAAYAAICNPIDAYGELC